eukprot:TRINITY_DN20480_c0_g1_i1.p1 TRINITY_DN20480_c0_g1~~TRINITY_DN20480_c0_g1_i1.p1  ORF type:complete len:514 (+),score=164.59 TRINITY_DN20480_c0_g1_i1:217-1758(+)
MAAFLAPLTLQQNPPAASAGVSAQDVSLKQPHRLPPSLQAEMKQPEHSTPSGSGHLLSWAGHASAALVGLSMVASLGRKRRSAPGCAGKREAAIFLRAQSDDEMDADAKLEALERQLEAMEEEFENEDSPEFGEAAGLDEALLKKADDLMQGSPRVKPGSGASASSSGQRVVLCGLGLADTSRGSGAVAAAVAECIKDDVEMQLQQLDLADLPAKRFEEVDELLKGCEVAIVCSDTSDANGATIDGMLAGLKSLLLSAPEEMHKIILLSRLGAQASKGGFNMGGFFGQSEGKKWADLEDELTSTARKRTTDGRLDVVVVRAGDAAGAAGASQVRCTLATEEPESGATSPATAAAALFQAMKLEVNTSFAVVEDGASGAGAKDWDELLLPFVGPELCRIEVGDARRAAIFAQEWAEEFFGASKPSMRFGVKTPVQLQNTESGVVFKFRPLNTLDDEPFEELKEGGVEFIAETPEDGSAARLRLVRCAYGWKKTVKENSERALVDKFRKDWEAAK